MLIQEPITCLSNGKESLVIATRPHTRPIMPSAAQCVKVCPADLICLPEIIEYSQLHPGINAKCRGNCIIVLRRMGVNKTRGSFR